MSKKKGTVSNHLQDTEKTLVDFNLQIISQNYDNKILFTAVFTKLLQKSLRKTKQLFANHLIHLLFGLECMYLSVH